MRPKLTPEQIRAAGDRDQALTMHGLSIYTGFSYGKIRELATREGFPRRLGLIIPSEFRTWLAGQPVDAPVATPPPVAAAA
ncbi:MAG: hypothetical protein JSR82_24320 [Verrucomicrobia bacterium]|nr:hypothetical protein [Verrucomicrobiota bacterium]